MPKLTVLDMVQDILNDMDSDEVNSFADTEEAGQVAQIIKTTYFEMIDRRDWEHLFKFGRLDSVGDTSMPTHLGTPDNLARMEYLRYNKKAVGDTKRSWTKLTYKTPESFIEMSNELDLDATNVQEVSDYGGGVFQIYNDRQPTYYTSFDDDFVVLDSYDVAIESSVQAVNTQVRMYTIPTWTHEDGFTPDLPMEAFSALLAEAKSVAMFKLDDEVDQKAEQQSERQQKRLSRQGWRIKGGVRYPDYGRKTTTYRSQKNASTGVAPTDSDIIFPS